MTDVFVPPQYTPSELTTPENRAARRWAPVAGAVALGLVLGGVVATAIGASNTSEQRDIALAAQEQAVEAEQVAQDAAADVAETKADAEAAIAKAKVDAEAAVASRLAEAEKLKTDAAAAAAKITADAEAAAAKTRGELDAQKASLDARAAALTGQEAEAKKNEFEGDGIYRVGADIAPGTYKSDNPTGGCYYARLSSLTAGGTDGIIDNNNVEGQVVIVVRASDAGLEVSDCGTFRKVD